MKTVKVGSLTRARVSAATVGMVWPHARAAPAIAHLHQVIPAVLSAETVPVTSPSVATRNYPTRSTTPVNAGFTSVKAASVWYIRLYLNYLLVMFCLVSGPHFLVGFWFKQHGETDCWPMECPPVHQCSHPVQLAGDCCPRCLDNDPCSPVAVDNQLDDPAADQGCHYQGLNYTQGSEWTSGLDDCTTCKCRVYINCFVIRLFDIYLYVYIYIIVFVFVCLFVFLISYFFIYIFFLVKTKRKT